MMPRESPAADSADAAAQIWRCHRDLHGRKHTTFNMALCDRDFANEATAVDLDARLSKLRDHDASMFWRCCSNRSAGRTSPSAIAPAASGLRQRLPGC